MTAGEMMELIQQHHADMGETEVLKLINRAMEDFSIKTKMITGTYVFNTIIDKRYYTLPDLILEIDEVYYDSGDSKGRRIPRLVGTPQEQDRG